MIDGYPRPDYGQGFQERVCATCSASWIGHESDGDWCPWCERRAELHRDHLRDQLLHPRHLRTDEGTPAYDRLDEVGRRVWDQTRGQSRGADSIVRWVADLRRHTDLGTITRDEAEAAVRRITATRTKP